MKMKRRKWVRRKQILGGAVDEDRTKAGSITEEAPTEEDGTWPEEEGTTTEEEGTTSEEDGPEEDGPEEDGPEEDGPEEDTTEEDIITGIRPWSRIRPNSEPDSTEESREDTTEESTCLEEEEDIPEGDTSPEDTSERSGRD